jgi:RimJ/RimL family protein N-acetyltransferase
MSNPAAIRSYEKAGFRREGVLRQDFKNQDGFVDVCVMSILKAEWLAGRA